MTNGLSHRTALATTVAWSALVVAALTLVVPWGHAGTVAYCKAGAGFVTGARATEDELDCVDRTVKDELNSRLDDVNVKGDAGIKGFKTDQTFSELRSTRSLVVAAPGMTLSSLGSTTLVSVSGPGLATPTIVLLSNYAGTAPPPINMMFANTSIKAWGLVSGANGLGTVTVASFNASVSFNVTGIYSVFFATPMQDSNYIGLAQIFNANGYVQSASGRSTRSFSFRTSDTGGNLTSQDFQFFVIGAQ